MALDVARLALARLALARLGVAHTAFEHDRAHERWPCRAAIGDRQAQEQLTSAALRAELDKQRQGLQLAALERESELRDLTRRLAHDQPVTALKDEEAPPKNPV